MKGRVLALATLAAALLASGCDPTAFFSKNGGQSSIVNLDAKGILLASVQEAQQKSFRADMSIDETMGITGLSSQLSAQLGSQLNQAIAISLHLDEESSQRVSGTAKVTSGSTAATTVAFATYDGTSYVSSDGGSTWRSVATPTSSSGSPYGNPLQYLNAIGTAVDSGAGSAKGSVCEKYHVTFDATKIASVIQSSLSGSSSASLSSLLGGLSFQGGSLEACVNNSNQLLSESATVDATFNLAALSSSVGGGMTLHEVIDASFYDYGASITVSNPAVTA